LKKNEGLQAPRPLTVAELCEALEQGLLPARMEDGEYIISHRDLARLAEAQAHTMKLPVPMKPISIIGVKAS
jgi:hypothetical protein